MSAPSTEERRVPWTAGYVAVHEARQKLPIYAEMEQILGAFDEHQVIIIDSPCGSGKTTQIPQFCVHILDMRGIKLNVDLIQPDGLAAECAMKRLALELDSEELVGLDGEGIIKMPPNRKDVPLVVTTITRLFARLQSNPTLEESGVLILDNVHEGSAVLDAVLICLHDLLERRPKLKLICMSATADHNALKAYFAEFNPVLLKLAGPPHAVDEVYTKEPIRDWIEAAANAVHEIIDTNGPDSGDIMIFSPGQSEIDQLRKVLLKLKEDNQFRFDLISVCDKYNYGDDLFEDRFFYVPLTDGSTTQHRIRKVILVAQFAETSSLLPGVNWVIDPLFRRIPIYNAKTDATEMLMIPSYRSQLAQRKGRTGRTGPGQYCGLYTREFLATLELHPTPPILETDVTPVIFDLAKILNGIRPFNWRTPLLPAQLTRAVDNLRSLGFVNDDGSLTAHGQEAKRFPQSLEPMFARLFIDIKDSPVAGDILMLIAILENGKMLRDVDPQVKDTTVLAPSEYGDHIDLINVFKEWDQNYQKWGSMLAEIAYMPALNMDACLHILNRVRNLFRMFRDVGYNTQWLRSPACGTPSYEKHMIKHIFHAWKHHLAIGTPGPSTWDEKVYRRASTMDEPGGQQELHVSPRSAMTPSRHLRHAIFTSLNYDGGSKRTTMDAVSMVPAEWVREWAPELLNPESGK